MIGKIQIVKLLRDTNVNRSNRYTERKNSKKFGIKKVLFIQNGFLAEI